MHPNLNVYRKIKSLRMYICARVMYTWVMCIPSANELRGFVIEISTNSTVAVCNEIKDALQSGEMRSITCRPGAIGSVVRIQKNKYIPGSLTLCEVEVYGGNTTLYLYMYRSIVITQRSYMI